MSLTRRELFEIWRVQDNITDKNTGVLTRVLDKLQLSELESPMYQHVKRIIQNLNSAFAQKWKECRRTLRLFLERHKKWLDTTIVFTLAAKKGRPMRKFSEVGNKSRRQKTLHLVEQYSTEELIFAAATSLRKDGKRDAAEMIQTIAAGSSNTATTIKRTFEGLASSLVPIKYTAEEALALYVDGRLTKHTYVLMRSGAKARNCDIYPSYKAIQNAKKACYPNKDSITFSEIEAEVKLQSLVDHTSARLVMIQEEVFEKIGLQQDLTLIYKWGCDGSAAHSSYKQSFGQENNKLRSDAYLFAVCLVPLRLQTQDNRILWNNPRPSSTRFCRPVKLLFEKESVELIRKEIKHIEEQITEIVPTVVSIGGQNINIKHSFELTMIDGKTFGVVTNSSSQTCGICGATPKIMNNLDEVVKRQVNMDSYNYGLSPLHAWIRSFETLLHISYRLTVQKWQIRDSMDKIAVNDRKHAIQQNFRSQMGLLVDIPKPGFGTTNDGNSARRFFKNPSLAASITGIDKDLIYRFSVILQTLSCGYTINSDSFEKYGKDTAKKFVLLYPWYNMPSSIHKILIHGADIIRKAILPIGMLSEEALESRNKDFKKYRERNTRKMSRQQTMEDLFHIILFSSDPIISTISKKTSTIWKKETTLDQEVIKLLADPKLPPTHVPSTSYDDSDHNSSNDSDEGT